MNLEQLTTKYNKTGLTITKIRQGIKSFKTEAKANNIPIWVGGENSFGGMKVVGTFQFKMAENALSRTKLSSSKVGADKTKGGIIPSIHIVPSQNGNFVSTTGEIVNTPMETLQSSIPDSWLAIWEANPNAVITAQVEKSGDFFNVKDAQTSNAPVPTTPIEEDWEA